MKYIIAMTFALAAFSVFSVIKTAEAGSEAPVVVELFTSQSCSSCPPADKLLGKIVNQHDNVIALSCHVTYWNHLHWKDTLSKSFCTDRQRDYGAKIARGRVYTPQMVINGQYEFVGSRSGRAKAAIKAGSNKLKSVEIMKSPTGYKVKLPAVGRGDYSVAAFSYIEKHTESIPSGENRGRTVAYTHPVTDLISLGNWDGSIKSKTFNVMSDHIAIVVSNKATGEIVAAGKSK